jgi:hypothetical protein
MTPVPPGLFSELNFPVAPVHVEAAASAFPAIAINVPRRNTIREDIMIPVSPCLLHVN